MEAIRWLIASAQNKTPCFDLKSTTELMPVRGCDRAAKRHRCFTALNNGVSLPDRLQTDVRDRNHRHPSGISHVVRHPRRSNPCQGNAYELRFVGTTIFQQ
ncbi:MAG: hypothetical protein MZU97_24060 [Bacillus subtilis]|nr:hypothetical protein [Bacillus subtilis]